MASKSSIEAGKGHVSLSCDMAPLVAGLNAAKARVQAFASGVAAVGAAIGGLGLAITGGALASLSSFTEVGSEIAQVSRITGIGVGQVGELMAGLGTDAEGLTKASEKLSVFLEKAADGSPEAALALGKLHLSLDQLRNMDQGGRLAAVAAALGGVADAADRLALTKELLGKSAAESLNVSGERGGFSGRLARAQELGSIMSPEDVALAKSTGRAFKEMGQIIKNIWREAGAAIAPVMREFFTMATNILIPIRAWISGNRELLREIFVWGRVLVGVGASIGFVAVGLYAGATAFGALATAIAWVNGLGIMQAGVWLVTTAVWLVAQAALWGLAGVQAVSAVGWGILTGALWLFNLALAVGKGAAFLAGAALGFLTGGQAAATVGAIILKIAMWAKTIAVTAATGGINLLTAALVALGVFLVGAAAIVLAGVGIFLALGAAAAGVGFGFDDIRETAQSAGSAVLSAFQPLLSFFGDLYTTFAAAFGGIKDSLMSGDLEGAANIALLGLRVAWNQTLNFFRPTWGEFSNWFMGTWDDLSAWVQTTWGEVSNWFLGLVDTFTGAWDTATTFLANLFDVLKSAIIGNFVAPVLSSIGALLTTLGSAMETLGMAGGEAASAAGQSAAGSAAAGREDAAGLDARMASRENERAAREQARAAERATRERELAELSDQLDAENAAAREQRERDLREAQEAGIREAEDLWDELEDARIEAAHRAELAQAARAGAGAAGAAGGGLAGGLQGVAVGTFSAAAIQGFTGGGDPVQNRLAAEAERQRELQELMVGLLEQIAAGPRNDIEFG